MRGIFENKKGKSFLIILVIVLVLIGAVFSFSAFAQQNETNSNDSSNESNSVVGEAKEVKEKAKEIANETLNYIEKFVKKSGVKESDINEVSEVDLNELPKEVVIKNIKETNIGVYEINYTKQDEQKKLYVVTYASPSFKAKENPIVACKNVQNLQFGIENANSSTFLKTASGVLSSAEQGYVMMRDGSITGISTNMKVNSAVSEGRLKIKIYKNGEDTGFENVIEATPTGIKVDYDSQSEFIDEFSAGDIISVYVEQLGSVEWQDVIVMVEITTG